MEIIILVGIPAAGKSTYCKNNLKDYVRVNLDTLKTRSKENKLIKQCIEENKSFVVDNTNVTIEERKKYIDIAKENNIPISCIWFPINRELSFKRNNERERHVPKVAIYTKIKRFIEPSLEEGFNLVKKIQ